MQSFRLKPSKMISCTFLHPIYFFQLVFKLLNIYKNLLSNKLKKDSISKIVLTFHYSKKNSSYQNSINCSCKFLHPSHLYQLAWNLIETFINKLKKYYVSKIDLTFHCSWSSLEFVKDFSHLINSHSDLFFTKLFLFCFSTR